jgi:transcriptional regulator GlxA family with amidase domain
MQRLSTACLAITNPHLKSAVAFIDNQFRDLLTTDEIADAAGVSRRQLYTIFRNEMRCSPTDYLTRVRLKEARNLITENKLNLYEIAEASGFNTARTLNRVFHQQFGIAPSKWHRQEVPQPSVLKL